MSPTSVGGISDQAGILSAAEKRSIRSSANELSIRFPQTYFTIATARLSEGTSLGAFAFWLFNQGGIVREIDRGSNNYEILLSIDTSGGRCSLMVGYGLEGLISESALEALIAAAQPSFAEGRFAAGIETVIAGMKAELTKVASRLEETHGFAPIVHTKSTAKVTSPADF
ncbi:MAG: TPM domain-containing protein [Verrucomicrobiales bacterium]